MDIVLTFVQGFLTLVILLAGTMKLIQPRSKIVSSGAAWDGFSARSIHLIGLGEVLCSVGISAPRMLGYGTYMTSASAVGICVFMMGAFAAHSKRKQSKALVANGVFFTMAAIVAYYRFPSIS